MKVGLLWFDDDGERGLEEKVARAARRYGEKFGRRANVCYVNLLVMKRLREAAPGTGAESGGNGTGVESGMMVGSVRVEGLGSVLLHHFWVGVEVGG
ncbi:MAG: hypothetical protein SWK90_14235 [Chloroflexota bacterium]|nr:hypothetical protein [Chloroflexota bacterium]